MFFEYPYVDLNQPNLDAIIRYTRESRDYIKNFTALNKVTFAGDWTPEKGYKIWSIVQDSEGNGYISVKPVPENVLLTNTEYWQPVAKYASLYEAFNERISDLENDNEDIKSDITALENDNEDIKDDIAALIAANRKRRTLRDCKCVLMGDSYAMGAAGTTDTGWIPQFISDSKCNAIKTAKMSSAGYIHPCGSGDYVGQNFVEALSSIISELSDSERAEIELVMCASGGINDVASNNVGDIGDAVVDYISVAKTGFPNAEIVVVPLYCDAPFASKYINKDGEEVTISNPTKKHQTFLEIYTQAITHGAVSTLSAIYWLMGRTGFGTGDGIHPNQYGFIQQSRRLINWLLGGDPRYTPAAIYAPGAADTTPKNFIATATDGVVNITGGIIVTNPVRFKSIISLPQDFIPGYSRFFPAVFSNGSAYEIGSVYYAPDDRTFSITAMPTIAPVDNKLTIYVNLTYKAGM